MPCLSCGTQRASAPLEAHWGATIARYPVGWRDTQTACVYDHRRCVVSRRAGGRTKRRSKKEPTTAATRTPLAAARSLGWLCPPHTHTQPKTRVGCILERRSYAAFLRARCWPSTGGGGGGGALYGGGDVTPHCKCDAAGLLITCPPPTPQEGGDVGGPARWRTGTPRDLQRRPRGCGRAVAWSRPTRTP